jgi:uncharacterized BrkB/YihY/UPF0761 family membrane protein
VTQSGDFGATYDPLTGVMALLLWANLTGIALFLGIAFAAQLEARRITDPDTGRDSTSGLYGELPTESER